jgi:site-specific recombinase XerD
MDRVAARRMPAIYQFPEQAEEGGFIGYGPNIIQISREITSRLLAKVLRGTKIADIPVEQPTKFGFALANRGHDTRALQAYLGHRNIQHTVRYTELSPTHFKNFWRE